MEPRRGCKTANAVKSYLNLKHRFSQRREGLQRHTEELFYIFALLREGLAINGAWQLRGVTEDQSIEVRIVAQGVQIVIVLGTHTKVWL